MSHGIFVVPNGFCIPGKKGGIGVVGLTVVVRGVVDDGCLVDVSLVDVIGGNVVSGVVVGADVLLRAVRNQWIRVTVNEKVPNIVLFSIKRLPGHRWHLPITNL